MKEVDTIQAACRGSLEAFNRLVRQYQDDVFDWLCWLLQDGRAAETATQRAFLQAYHELGSYPGGSFRAWLLSSAARLCALRKPGNGTAPRSGENPLGLFLQGLPAENQDAAFLVDVLQLSYAEAAVVQGVSVSTIQSRVARARLHACTPTATGRHHPSRTPNQ